jgi:hypothetical protein
MFEHVAAKRIVRVYEEACLVEQRREPVGAVRWGRLFFGYFHFGEAKESD